MKSQFIDTAGLRMHYLQQGSGSESGSGSGAQSGGQPVVLIHGFPETSYSWRHQLEALSTQHAVFAPDNRGFGQTDKPGARVTRSMLARDIIDFMDALGLEDAAIVGHDWGGIIAFKVAIDYPERVSHLALLDTLCTVWHPGGIHGYWFKAAPYPEEFFARYHRQFIETVIGMGTPELPGPPQSPWVGMGARASWASAEDFEHYATAFADPASHWHAISYYRDALPFHIVHDDPGARHGERYEYLDPSRVADMWTHADGMDKHPLYPNYLDYGPEDRHKQFSKPALWMMSAMGVGRDGDEANTTLPTGNPFVEQFPRYLPNLQVQPIRGGHFFPEENPADTNARLMAFLAD